MINIFFSFLPVDTMYMDAINNCFYSVSNDAINIGDKYVLMSDRWGGEKANLSQRQPECYVVFNFVDRLLAANFTPWRCDDRALKEGHPTLRIYDDCTMLRPNTTNNLLVS